MPTGVLSNKDIEREISDRQLILGPDAANIQPSCYDMRVGHIITARVGVASHQQFPKRPPRFGPGDRPWLVVWRLLCGALWYSRFWLARLPLLGSGLPLPPQYLNSGEVATLVSEEVVKLPFDITGLVIPRNSFAQNGLLILNAGHVDPGWHGAVTAQVVNLNRLPLQLSVGDSVFSIVFEYMHSAAKIDQREIEKHTVHDPEGRNRDIYGAMLQRQSLLSLEDLRGEFITHGALTWEMLKRLGPLVLVVAGLAAVGSLAINYLNLQINLLELARSLQPMLPTPTLGPP